MSKKKWAAVLAVLGFLVFFVPFVPQTTSADQFLGAHYQTSADVSPSYYVFHCGSYINSRFTAQLASGFSGFYDLSKGYTFSCVYNSA